MVKYNIAIRDIRYAISTMEFKDTKCNRESYLQCKSASNIVIEHRDRIMKIVVHPGTNIYDNVVVHSFDIKMVTNGVDKSFNYKS